MRWKHTSPLKTSLASRRSCERKRLPPAATLLQLLANEVASTPMLWSVPNNPDQSTFDDLVIFSSVRFKQPPWRLTTLDDIGPSSAAVDGPF